MKTNKHFFIIFLIILFSCSSNDDSTQEDNNVQITVSTSDFSVTIDEGLPNGTIIGTINGSTNEGSVTFSILSQNPNNSFEIDTLTGELSILNSENFDYDTNPQITGSIKVSNNDVSKTSNVTINLNAVEEENVFNGDIILSSQQEVNDFGAQLYTEITGYLQIYGDDITSLTPLQSLTKVGDLYLGSCDNLASLEGLNNLTEVANNLSITGINALTNIDQLSQITSVNGDLRIFNNAQLTSLTGLTNITTVGDRFVLEVNTSLTTLDGLNLVTVGGNFEFGDNDSLSDISALTSLTSVGGDMHIGSGAFTDLSGFSNLNTVSGDLYISGPNLTNLNGLQNLNHIGEIFSITYNDNLLTLDGLANNITFGSTTDLNAWLIIENNYALADIDALEQITNYISAPMIQISNNFSLTSIDGLLSIDSCILMQIENNNNLTNLNGLSNLTSIVGNGDLKVQNNASLNNLCGIAPLIQNNGLQGDYNVTGNLYNPTEQDILDGNCND